MILSHVIIDWLVVYVSSVWNCYRKCRLLLLNFIYTCSNLLNDKGSEAYSQKNILKEAKILSESLASSVLFHLLRNPEAFVDEQQSTSSNPSILVNQSIGGLLIMHPLNAVSSLEIIPPDLRQLFREHLAWIGNVMGIGQALLLADVS